MTSPKVNDKILATRGDNKTTRQYMTVTVVNGTTVDAVRQLPTYALDGFEPLDQLASGLTYDENAGPNTWRWPSA